MQTNFYERYEILKTKCNTKSLDSVLDFIQMSIDNYNEQDIYNVCEMLDEPTMDAVLSNLMVKLLQTIQYKLYCMCGCGTGKTFFPEMNWDSIEDNEDILEVYTLQRIYRFFESRLENNKIYK